MAYAFQIYFDFSGYSDMAIGLGKIFGFNFLENFNYPYISKTITDFWRRWHMSLSTWFRDYVYLPLGGNRVSKIKWLRNIMIVWLLTGLWHGASWNYVVWGLYYGIILIIEKLWLGKLLDKCPKILQHLYAILFILIGWVIFRVENFSELLVFITRMFTFQKSNFTAFIVDNDTVISVWPYFLLAFVGATPIIKKLFVKMDESKKKIINYSYDFLILILFGLTIVYLISSTYNPFIYFRF